MNLKLSQNQVTIEENIDNKSCSTTWVGPKTVFEPYPDPKNRPLGPSLALAHSAELKSKNLASLSPAHNAILRQKMWASLFTKTFDLVFQRKLKSP